MSGSRLVLHDTKKNQVWQNFIKYADELLFDLVSRSVALDEEFNAKYKVVPIQYEYEDDVREAAIIDFKDASDETAFLLRFS